MKRSTRLAMSIAAVVGALAVAGSAAAVPRLTVGTPQSKLALGGSTVSIRFTEERTDAAPAKLVMYAPAGYTANGAAVGQQIGTVHANFQTLASSTPGAASITGTITAEDPAKYLTTTCQAGPHKYIWLLNLTIAGKAVNVPVFVDTPIPTSDKFAGQSQIRLSLCLSSPYSQAGATRMPNGAKLTNLALTLNPSMVVNPSTRGLYTWRTMVTPYTVNSGAVNTAGTVEARAVVLMPKRISLRGKVVTKRQRVRVHGKVHTRVTNWAVLRGRVLEGTQGTSAVRVAFLSGLRPSSRLILRGTTKTSPGGFFTKRIRLGSKSSLIARVDIVNRDVTSRYCATAAAGVPCVSATAPAFSIVSDAVTLKPRRR